MQRRTLLTSLAAASTPTALPASAPRWRGFNLQEKFTHNQEEWKNVAPEWARSNEPFAERDFDIIAELGFNFARLPMSYRCWTDPARPHEIQERPVREIEQALHWAKARDIHVCLNFHRAPGFCINQALSPEPWNLWTDSQAQDIFYHHWRYFATRFRAFGPRHLSFNLVNEPNRCTMEQYVTVMLQASAEIRRIDPQRPLMFDGLFGEAILPVPRLLEVPSSIHSTRGYAPFKLSHYLAAWAGTPRRLPTWPLLNDGPRWDPKVFQQYCIRPYQELSQKGAHVFVGEFGCYNRTPHRVALAWMQDCLAAWKALHWGWALWCLRGSFGILESNRTDVKYERWKGLRLDRAMLELLKNH